MLTKPQIVAVSSGAQRREVWHWILHGTGQSKAVASCVSEIQVSCSEVSGKHNRKISVPHRGSFLRSKTH